MEILIFLLIIILFSLYAEKNGYYASIMLDAPTIALCPKLCRHNVSNPTCYRMYLPLLQIQWIVQTQPSARLQKRLTF